MDAGLPAALPVNAIEINPADTGTYSLLSDVGVPLTRTAGAAWTFHSQNDGRPELSGAKDHQLHPEAQLLPAGTQALTTCSGEIAVDAATMPDVDLYLRDSAVDTGRLSPWPSRTWTECVVQFGAETFLVAVQGHLK